MRRLIPMIPTILLAGLALTGLGSGLGSGLAPGPAAGQTLEGVVPETEAACVDAGGRWERGGLAGRLLCVLPTPDAGKACTTAEDCTGFCLAQTGTCSTESPMFGCFAIVDLDGAAVTICID